MTCQWQTGFLIAQPCGLPAGGGCAMCGRMLCAAHTVMGSAGPACPQCASTREDYPDTDDTEVAEARQQYYSSYGAPPAFGDSGFFSGGDAGALRQGFVPQQQGAQPEYDPMET